VETSGLGLFSNGVMSQCLPQLRLSHTIGSTIPRASQATRALIWNAGSV